MTDTKSRALIAWCEDETCGRPIYTGDKHTECVSDNGNRYFYCAGCVINVQTPDQALEQEVDI